MPTIKAVEDQIFRVERFKVHILTENGRDIRGDRSRISGYTFVRALSDEATVRAWKDGRFKRSYPGFDVVILDGQGRSVGGGKRLATVRATYARPRS